MPPPAASSRQRSTTRSKRQPPGAADENVVTGDVNRDEVLSVLAACRVLVGVTARSMAAVGPSVDVLQFRVLVIVAGRESLSLSQLAEAAKITLTRASRLCERMVADKLLHRVDDPDDRRQLNLTLTARGRRIVDKAMRHRQREVASVLARMPRAQRGALVTALAAFAAAGGETADSELWALGWPG